MTLAGFLLPDPWSTYLQHIDESSRNFWERQRIHRGYLRLQSIQTWRGLRSWLFTIERVLIPDTNPLTPFERFLLHATSYLCEVGWQEQDALDWTPAERYAASGRRIMMSLHSRRGETDLGLADLDSDAVEILARLSQSVADPHLSGLERSSAGGYEEMVRVGYLGALLQLAHLLFVKGRTNENLLASLPPLEPANIIDARLALQPYLSGLDVRKDGLTVHMKAHAADAILAEKMHALFMEPLRVWWGTNWEWLFRDYGFFLKFLPAIPAIKPEGASSLSPLAQTCPALKDFLETFQRTGIHFPTSIADITTAMPSTQEKHIPSLRTIAFISCSEHDEKYLKELEEHLKPFIRKEGIDVWTENKIRPGSKWKEEVENALEKTKVAVVLVSARFLASEFITEKVLPPLLLAAKDDGAMILPVILGASAFADTDLAQFKAANDLSKPIAQLSPARRDKIWNEVAGTIRDALKSTDQH